MDHPVHKCWNQNRKEKNKKLRLGRRLRESNCLDFLLHKMALAIAGCIIEN
jgi:hypothetical protein